MAQVTTLQLLPQTTYQNPGDNSPYDVVGNAVQAAGYYLSNQDLQTIVVSINDFTGTIVLEATLAREPDEIDWFRVFEYTANVSEPSEDLEASTANFFRNIEGNFVFVRAKILGFNAGTLDYMMVSY